MRMWNVPVERMCRQHLLGEHVEMHMFTGCLNKNKKIDRYIQDGLVEVHNIKNRHEQLVNEMKARGYAHKSKLPKYKMQKIGRVDSKENLIELRRRCKECRKLK